MSFSAAFIWPFLCGLFLWATFIQLVAWWGVFARLTFWKNTPMLHTTMAPVSIIICARNEAENLRNYLEDVLNQQYEAPWELIVVDDASTDETQDTLQVFQEKFPTRLSVLRLSEKNTPGKKQALATGIAAAKYNLILLTDADCQPASPFWVRQMSAKLTAKPETEIVLGYGPYFKRKSEQSWFHRRSAPRYPIFPRYETAFTAAQYCAFALAGMPYMGVGRNLAFKREIFDRVGGFSAHAHIPSGDDDLLINAAANAKNTAICLDPESFMYSEGPASWSEWGRQKQRHLTTAPAYRKFYKNMLGLLALSHAGHYLGFLVLILAGYMPVLVLAMFFLRQFSVWFILGNIFRVLIVPELMLLIPVFDAFMATYYGVLGPWYLSSKKRIKWARAG